MHSTIQDFNIRERRVSQKKQENVYYEMTGRMSAVGQLGKYKYNESHGIGEYTRRTTYIAEDIEPKKNVEKHKTIEDLKLLELRAINKPHGKLRPVLHKGLYKHNPWDFQMPQDVAKLRDGIRQQER